jgi:outer membrane protein assembly complex protein YaeT
MRILRLTLIILAAVFLLAFSLFLAVQTPPAERYVLHKVSASLRGRGIDFQASSLRYNLFTLRASLTGVVVRSAAAPGLPPVAAIPRVDLRARWGPLLHGTVAIENVALERPAIEIVRDRRGRDNLPRLTGAGAAGGTGRFFLGKLTAPSGTLRVVDRGRQLDVTLPWRLDIEGDRATGAYALHLAAGNGPPIELGRRKIPLDRLLLEAVLRGGRLEVSQLDLESPHTTISASGTLAPIGDPRANFAIRLRVDLARWARILRLQQPVRGELNARLTATGPLAGLQIAGTLDSSRLVAGKLGPAALRARFRLDAATQRLALESANVSLLGGTARGQGQVALAAAAGTSRVNLQFEKLDVLQLCRAFDLPVAIASRAQGSAEARWPALSFSSLGWKADLNLVAERQSPARGIVPVTASLTAASERGTMSVQLHSLEAMDARVTGSLAIGPAEKLQGTFQADVARLSGLMDSLSAYLGKPQPLADERLEGRVSLRATLGGRLDAPEGAAKFSASDLQIGEPARQLPSLEGDLTLRGRDAHLVAHIPSLGLTADARADLRAPYPLELTARVPKTSFASFPVKLPAALEGEIALTLDARGDLQNWRRGVVEARVESLQARWRNLPIELRRPAEVRYRAGELGLQAALQIKDSSLDVNGSLPLEPGTPGDVQLQSRWNLATLVSLLPQAQRPQAAGELEINGHIRGSLRRLDPALDVSLAGARIDDKRLRSPVTDLALQAQLRGAILHLQNLSAQWAGGTLKGSGRLPLAWLPVKVPAVLPAQREPVSLALEADGLKLQSIRGLPEAVQGTVSLQAQAQAAEPTLDAVRATLTIPRMELTAAGLSFREPKPARITLQNGVARIAEFALEGPRTRVSAEGTANFHAPRSVDVNVKLRSNAAILASFVPSVSAQGPVELNLSVKGTPASPQLTGFLETKKVSVALESPPLLLEDTSLRVDFAGSRATIARFEGSLNGGKLTATGGMSYAGGELRDVDVRAQADGVFFQYPEGLKTLANLKLQLQSRQQSLLLGGQVNVVEGSYRKSLSLEGDLLPFALGQRGSFTPTERRNAFLDRLRFDVGIDTESPIIMDNNLGTLAVFANLRLTGSYYNMGLLGRMTMEEGGKLRLNERTYTLDRGTVTFTSPQSIEASPDIVARTQAAGYDITLQITKQAGKVRTDLTSQPPLSEGNIIAVLLTGRTLEEARGQAGTIAQQQALSYVAGRLGQTLSSQVQGGLGLTTVRLEPSLISAESDPGARLTVGQDITPQLNLSYSINLTDSSDQIWAAQYDFTRRFTTRAVKQSDNSYRFELRHHLTFGGLTPLGMVAAAKPKQPVISGVEFTGTPGFPPAQLSDRLKVKPGNRYDFFKLQKGVERLQKFYWKRDFLQARIRTSRTLHDSNVDLKLHIRSGPAVDFAFDGWSPSSGTRKRVNEAWRNGAFEQQRVANAVAALRDALVRQDYLQAKVTPQTTKSREAKQRTVRFRIEPGAKFRDVKLVFPGAKQISPSALNDLLKDEKRVPDVYLQPSEVTQLLTGYYREHGYLAASVEKPRYRLDAKTGTGETVIPVTEGPRFHIGKLEFQGNRTYSNAQIAGQAGLKSGEAYLPKLREQAADRVRAFYLNHGFSDVSVRTASREDPSAGLVNLDFRITENKQRVVKTIEISGTEHTSESLVRKQLALKPGQVLANDKLGQSLTRLYETGAYADVDIQPRDLPATAGLKPNQLPVRLMVKLREVPPWDLSYGGYFDTDRGPGGIVDLANHNMIGGARTIGMRVRYDDLFREARVYLTQPALHKFFPKADLAAYANRDQRDAFVTKRLGFSFQQEMPLQASWVLTYGYGIERATTISLDPTDTSLNSEERLAPLTLSLTRETRNDVLDATRGLFLSNAVELGSKYLGSGVQFVRYVGQYFQYVPLSRPVSVPFSRMKQPRLVWASALRIGAGGGLAGQELSPSQRFFAGGGTTIRGFGQDDVGPKDSMGQPVGGNAVFILNQELRFPIYSLLGGAAFVDVGNVYPTISDFNPFDVRSSAGLGLRVRTPIVLIRVDYGIKLDRKPGESFGKLFVSIGQAF